MIDFDFESTTQDLSLAKFIELACYQHAVANLLFQIFKLFVTVMKVEKAVWSNIQLLFKNSNLTSEYQ